MDFCDCGALLVPDKQSNGKVIMKCPSCGKMINPETNKKAFEFKQAIHHSDMEKTVIIEDEKGDVVSTAVLLGGPHKGQFFVAYVMLQMHHPRLTKCLLRLLDQFRINIHA